MYFNRDRIQTGRESQTEDLAGKTKERANRIIELSGKTEPARIDRQQLQREVVQDRTYSIQLSYRSYGFLTNVQIRTAYVQVYESVQHVWEAVLLAVQPSRGVLGFS